MIVKQKIFACLALLSTFSLHALELDLKTAIQLYLDQSYDLKIAQHESEKSRASLITAKERPNPILNASYEFLNIEKKFNDKARGSNAQATVILAHPIETAGKRDKRIELANHTIAYSDLIYDKTLREQLINLIGAYYTLVKDQSDFFNAVENAKAYQSLVVIAKTKYDNGFLSAIDYQKMYLQQIDYNKEVENTKLSVVQDRELLASLLALSSSNITLKDTSNIQGLNISLKELLSQVEQRPDCKAAKQNITVANSALEVEKANATPNVTVGTEYASFGPIYEPLLGFNLTMPLPIYDRNEGDIEKARIEKLQASNIYDKTVRLAQSDIIQNYFALESRKKVHQSMIDGFKTSKDLKEKQERVFTLKGMSVLELLDAQKAYRDYQRNMTHSSADLYYTATLLKLNAGVSVTEIIKGF